MTVFELINQLSAMPPDATVRLAAERVITRTPYGTIIGAHQCPGVLNLTVEPVGPERLEMTSHERVTVLIWPVESWEEIEEGLGS